jgi:UDP-2,4-diacetamido-2,4,6-trideoxy-beta-L-altropyranose hydrolase
VISKTPVFLRADGSSKIGLGHVHRLLALSEMLYENFDCKFVTREPFEGVRQLMGRTCNEIVEIEVGNNDDELTLLKTRLRGNEIVVLDGYHFDTRFQQAIKALGSGLVCIDDLNNQHFVSDLIINPAGNIDARNYSKEHYSKLCSGPAYALLKKPFLEAAQNRLIRNDKCLFICMGGADPNNYSLSILKACLDFPFDEIWIVVGEAYKYKESLLTLANSDKRAIHILSNQPPQELADVMKKCGVAICSASGIAYEYLSVGGELYVVQTATNQQFLYNFLINDGLAFDFNQFRVPKPSAQQSLRNQTTIFDGNSGKRILRMFNKLDFEVNVSVRKARPEDVEVTFNWANDPESRQQSFNQNTISFPTHQAWFNSRIDNPNTHFYIFEFKGTPVAQVRFDIKGESIVSYSIDKRFRGRGWGTAVLAKAIECFRKEIDSPPAIVGFVKKDNAGSKFIFEKLGFVQTEATEYPAAYKYINK